MSSQQPSFLWPLELLEATEFLLLLASADEVSPPDYLLLWSGQEL